MFNLFIAMTRCAVLAIYLTIGSFLYGAGAEDATARASVCIKVLREIGNAYSTRNSAQPVKASELAPGDWVITKETGVMRFDSYDPITGKAIVRLPSAKHEEDTATIDAKSILFAKLNTETARSWMEGRTRARFEKPENFDLMFAFRGLSEILGSEKAPTSSDDIKWAQVDSIWKEIRSHYPSLSEDDAAAVNQRWAALFAQGAKRTQIRDEVSESLREFVKKYYQATGHNLVQGGILTLPMKWNPNGSLALRGRGSKFGTSGGQSYVISSDSVYDMNVRGDIDSIPPDVFHQVLVDTWKRSEAELSQIGLPRVALMNYQGSQAETPGTPSQLLKAFKVTGDLGPLSGILKSGSAAPAFETWKNNLRKSPDSILFVPTPGSSGSVDSTGTIARWVQQEVGVGKVLDDPIQLLHGTNPQTFQSNLWARIFNSGEKEFAIPSSVEGKTIVLVDDVQTTGSTTEILRQRLLANRARAVYVFSIAKTGENPSAVSSGAMMALAPTLAAPKVEKGASLRPNHPPAPQDNLSFFGDQDALLKANQGLPWTGKIPKQMSPGEVSERKRFVAAFEKEEIRELTHLSVDSLSRVDIKGVVLKNASVKSLIYEIKNDDLRLLRLITKLYHLQADSESSRMQNSELGKLVIQTAKDKLAKPGPFRNQMIPELGGWIDSHP